MKPIAKKVIIPLIFLLIGFFLGWSLAKSFYSQVWNINLPSEVQEQTVTVSLMLDFGNGEINTYPDIKLNQGETVFTLLKKVTQENNLEFSYKDYGGELGAFIESINNLANNPQFDRFWQYWVNNEYAQVGASQYQLQDGDVVEWKYTKGQIK